MKRKFLIFLLAAVFCVNSMTVFAESEKIVQDESTETGEINETVQTEDTEGEKETAEEASETSDTITKAKQKFPKMGRGG